MSAPWEDDVNALRPLAWEDDSDAVASEASDGEWEAPPPTAGQNLVAHLLNLYMRRRLFAEDVCIATHHASDQFAEAKPYAKPPGLSSGKYNDHMKAQLGYTRDNAALYDLPLPAKAKGSPDRTTVNTFGIPGHELIQHDWESNLDDLKVRLQEAVDSRSLPPSYFDHPVVRAHGGTAPVFPLAFFWMAFLTRSPIA
jgi:hypothetical protein